MVVKCPYDRSNRTILSLGQHHLLDFCDLHMKASLLHKMVHMQLELVFSHLWLQSGYGLSVTGRQIYSNKKAKNEMGQNSKVSQWVYLMHTNSQIFLLKVYYWNNITFVIITKIVTSNSLIEVSALPDARNLPSGLNLAHLATFYMA